MPRVTQILWRGPSSPATPRILSRACQAKGEDRWLPEGVIYGFPVRCKQGEYHIVQDLSISEQGRKHMENSYRELVEEREHVKHLLG